MTPKTEKRLPGLPFDDGHGNIETYAVVENPEEWEPLRDDTGRISCYFKCRSPATRAARAT
jgi:hypothetical protein